MQRFYFCALAAVALTVCARARAAPVVDNPAPVIAPISVLNIGPAQTEAASTIYDATSDLTGLTTTTSTPHTYLGQAFNATNEQGSTPFVTGFQMGQFIIGAHTYLDVHMRVQFWSGFDPAAA